MSRIGRKPVAIPDGVELLIDGSAITVKGKKGELFMEFTDRVKVVVEENEAVLTRKSDEKQDKALHGLSRALLQNMVTGVTEGFEKKLEIIGVGYRAQASGSKINLTLGFSHPVEMQAPEGVKVEMEKDTNYVVISGIDKQKVGQFAAEIRKLRKPEPYKGKGVRYVGEYVPRKAGKAAAK